MSIIITTTIFLVQDLEWLIQTHMWSMIDQKIKKVNRLFKICKTVIHKIVKIIITVLRDRTIIKSFKIMCSRMKPKKSLCWRCLAETSLYLLSNLLRLNLRRSAISLARPRFLSVLLWLAKNVRVLSNKFYIYIYIYI